MSKDIIHLVSKEFHSKPVVTELKPLTESVNSGPESILPDGRLNLECPCLHSVLAHRCGYLMREAIRCFNESSRNPRGIECEDQFVSHAICMDKFDKLSQD